MRTKSLSQALEFALQKHGSQVDKQGFPYILHIIRVVGLLFCQGYSSEILIVGALHDVVEDTDATLTDIQARFGRDVADAVFAISKGEREDYARYLSRVSENRRAATVKVADLMDNLLTWRLEGLPDDVRDRLEPKYKDALEYLEPRGK